MSIEERAKLYLQTIGPAIEGQHGHDKLFHAACILVLGFNMSIDQAKPVLDWFNESMCVPPWEGKERRELERKLREADKQDGPRGYLLSKHGRPPEKESTQKKRAEPQSATESPALALGEYFEEMIEGKRFAAEWPWPVFHNLTKALKPRTIAVISAAEGTSKTLFVLEADYYWTCKKDYRVAVLMLEEDRNYHLTRLVAQLSENSNFTDEAWVKRNPDLVRRTWAKYAKELNAVGSTIWEGPAEIDTDFVLMWLETQCAAGKRIIVVDPITARDPSDKPWIDDHRFMVRAKDILKASESSLVLVAHPPKGASRNDWGGDVAGGAAYRKFSQTIVYIRGLPETKEETIITPHGRVPMEVNRHVELAKTRNGKGWYTTIGMYMDPNSLRHIERGIIAKGKR